MSFKIIQMENNHLRNECYNKRKEEVSCHYEINNTHTHIPASIVVINVCREIEKEAAYFCSITAWKLNDALV